jgi:hypothetical protein
MDFGMSRGPTRGQFTRTSHQPSRPEPGEPILRFAFNPLEQLHTCVSAAHRRGWHLMAPACQRARSRARACTIPKGGWSDFQHRCELLGVDLGVVAVAVVEQDVGLLGLAGQGGDLGRPLC